ncbi:putative outer membrane usher protein ycbS [Salmonella enterica subsp. arizonae]|nr:putative outer membrane usher protein ycbS [Salmonella enterica subsp. arizonae]
MMLCAIRFHDAILFRRGSIRIARLALIIALVPVPGWTENYFNPAFLSDDPSAVADLSTFSRNAQAAGMYRVDVYLNNTFFATKDVSFQAVKTTGQSAPTDDSGLHACLTPEMLKNMGVNTGRFRCWQRRRREVARISPVRYRPPGPALILRSNVSILAFRRRR